MENLAVGAIMRESAWILFKLTLPMAGAALAVGLVISLVQALTQIQESSLAFLPKFIILVLLGIWLMPWMGDQLGGFALNLMDIVYQAGNG